MLDTGARFKEALVAKVDKVYWGLPLEYQPAVDAVLRAEPQPVLISHAAHGAIGSSQAAFAGAARLLCRILAGGLPSDDAEIWRLRDRCWEST